MKKILTFSCLVILVVSGFSQQNSSVATAVDPGYFITHTRTELIKKLVDLPFGIKPDDPTEIILQKIETYLVAFQPEKEYSDDVYAKAANLQALKSLKQGGYGIGSVLIDKEGKIIAAAQGYPATLYKRRFG